MVISENIEVLLFDIQRYNQPNAKVVVIMADTELQTMQPERYIRLRKWGVVGKVSTSNNNIYSSKLWPLQLPLLFPFGDKRWKAGLTRCFMKNQENNTNGLLQIQVYATRK